MVPRINIEIPYNTEFLEELHLRCIQDDIKNGYFISYHDFDIYCAILIRLIGLDKLPNPVKDYCTKGDELIDSVTTVRLKLSRILRKIVQSCV